MAVVTLTNVGKQYPNSEEWAVNDVSFTVADGEFMVLLGPSGCGKSTTLRMIAGLESITAGTLAIDDEIMNKVPAKDRDIAMVFQSYALYPHMSVRDNLAFGLRRRRVDKGEIKTRVEDVADMLGLTVYLARKPFALSGGQRQRVALGRAIVRDPKVFLFDEPLSNLDAALRVGTRNELIKLHRRLGTTMIYVTHDQVEAMTMGTRICIMNEGCLVQVGPPLDVYRNPADSFVARFLGNPPMNLVDGTLFNQNSAMAVKIGNAVMPLPRHDPSLLASHADRHVIVGFRPEDMYEGKSGLHTDIVSLPAEVTTVESLGAETLLALRIAGVDQEVTARVGRESTSRPGDSIDFHIDLNAVQLFDAETTKVISTSVRNEHAPLIIRDTS